jgi:hypothetical protein
MKRRSRIVLAAVGVALLAALAGCGSGSPKPSTSVVQAASGFMETEKVDGLAITLVIPDPIHIGDNRIVVTLDKNATAVEVQVIMGTMGHGTVADLTKNAGGAWEATTSTINMEGKWLIRVKATMPDGTDRSALFQFTVKP